MKENNGKNSKTGWIIVLLVIILFAMTSPKNIQDYGENNSKYYKVNNYLLFSTCSASYWGGTVWKIDQIGVLGMTFKVKK